MQKLWVFRGVTGCWGVAGLGAYQGLIFIYENVTEGYVIGLKGEKSGAMRRSG